MNEQFKYLPNGVARIVGVPEIPVTLRLHYEDGTHQDFLDQSPTDLKRVFANSPKAMGEAFEIVGKTELNGIIPLNVSEKFCEKCGRSFNLDSCPWCLEDAQIEKHFQELLVFARDNNLCVPELIPFTTLEEFYVSYLEAEGMSAAATKFREMSLHDRHNLLNTWKKNYVSVYDRDDHYCCERKWGVAILIP
jgi:hypothetical protein